MKLSPREAKWVARTQTPRRLGYTRKHQRQVEGILTHRIVRDLTIDSATAQQYGLNAGDVIEVTNPDRPAWTEGLFRVVLAESKL
ncbi:MAG TPA: hypothetical protein VNG71_04455 [Pyrinomonadaceae bacterium]|nr:hypothetical protein [Pyrinomonadaceae bacterium]